MKRALIALTAGALAVGTATVPNRADAIAEWVVPAIIASGLGGTIVGAGAATAPERRAYYDRRAYYRSPSVAYYGEPGVRAPVATYAAPARQCWITQAQRPDGRLIDVRVCD